MKPCRNSPPDQLQQHVNADDFDASAGRGRTAPHEHQKQEQHLAYGWPGFIVWGGEARCRQNGCALEGGIGEGSGKGRIRFADQQGRCQEYGGRSEKKQVELKFRILPEYPEAAFYAKIKEIKVDPAKHHERSDHHCHIRAAEVTDSIVVIGKTAGSHRAEGLHERIVQVQSAEHQQDGFQHGKEQVNHIEDFSRVGHLGRNFIE